MISIKSLYNPRCSHIVTIISYNNSKLVYFYPDTIHFGDYKFISEKKREVKTWFKQGKWNFYRRLKSRLFIRMVLKNLKNSKK